MQDTNINIRATKADKRLHARASKKTAGKRDAVIAGLRWVAEECGTCGKKAKCPLRSTKGYPVCVDCAESGEVSIKTDN